MAYPTPDTPSEQGFRCVEIYIPTSVEDVFFSIIMGQIGELTKEYYWVQSGTMTPEQASFLWSEATALTDADGQGCDEMDCNDVIDCIGGSAGTEATSQANLGLNTETQNAKLGKGVAVFDSCSEDHVWGAVNKLVDYLSTAGTDTIELIEASTNITEVFANWLSFVLPSNVIEALASYVAWLQDSIGDSYEAQKTDALLDEYKCDLFCLYIDNCRQLSPRDVAEYFESRLTSVSVTDTIFNLIDFLILGSWTGTQIVDAVMFSMVGVMIVGDNPVTQILIPSLYSLNSVFALGANDPSDDWEILCDECTPSTVEDGEWDFTISDGGFVPANNRGVYSALVGWITEVGSGNSGCWISKELPSDVVISKIEMDWEADNGTWRRAIYGRNNPASSSGQVQFFDSTSNSTGGASCAVVSGVDRNYLLCFIDSETSTIDGKITRIAIEYLGTEPSGFTSTSSITYSC